MIKSGGHSIWSTIGSEGFIIDLSNYSGITVDSLGPVAKLRGSILTKTVAVHLAKDGYFAGKTRSDPPNVLPKQVSKLVPTKPLGTALRWELSPIS